MSKLLNIIRTSLKSTNLLIVFRKLLARFERDTSSEALIWAHNSAREIDPFFEAMDASLWEEAKTVSRNLEQRAIRDFGDKVTVMGGRANCEILYFLVRYMNAKSVLETGVAAGWSSQAVLTAMEKNQIGSLFSSDFPYLRLDDPMQYIGILVDESFKHRWKLDVRGDRLALPNLINKAERLDVFHYDSDKSYSGRQFAFQLIKNRMQDKGYVIFDDIQDNMHFADLVTNEGLNYHVFKSDEKYVGLIQYS